MQLWFAWLKNGNGCVTLKSENRKVGRSVKKLFDAADRYVAQSNWKDFALVKFCLCAIGVIIGVLLPQSVKTAAFWVALVVFVITYIVLMTKFFRVLLSAPTEENHETEEV
jgi:uncharacterized membrane protein YoaK (UPF0700 family)